MARSSSIGARVCDPQQVEQSDAPDFTKRFGTITCCESQTRAPADSEFNHLALELFQLQYESIPVYQKFCQNRGVDSVKHWSEIPAIPTSAFKEHILSSLPPEERTTVFHSSGTTQQIPGRHFHSAESLTIYEASLLPWFQKHFLAGVHASACLDDAEDNLKVEHQLEDSVGMLCLTPSPALASNSSLVHMFDAVQKAFGSRDSIFTGRIGSDGAWTLDMDQTLFALRKSMCANRPIALLGTAFSFVHLLDHFAANNIRYKIAAGSRVMETGGYKGRSRVMPKAELHALITKHLGVPPSHIVSEYGMSELSSQAYSGVVGQTERSFHFPPWARAQIISPETGAEAKTGLLRIFDLANVRSVMAIQTEDLAEKHGDGFELLGRATEAEPRGCSLMAQ